MSGDTKAAPNLADQFEKVAERYFPWSCESVDQWETTLYDQVFAALRAVDAVRAIHQPEYPRTKSGKYVGGCKGCDCCYYPCKTIIAIDGVEAVQALLQDVAGIADAHGDFVDAVKSHSHNGVTCEHEWPCPIAKAIQAAAVQALVEGER